MSKSPKMAIEDTEERRLRDCRFCGSSDVSLHRPGACPKCGEPVIGPWYVMCNSCGGSTGTYLNEEDAVDRWNGVEGKP